MFWAEAKSSHVVCTDTSSYGLVTINKM